MRRGFVRLPPILPKMSPIEIAPIEAPGMLGSSIIGSVGPGLESLDLDLLVVELVVAELSAEAVARAGRGCLADEGIEQPFFGREMGLRLDILASSPP